MRPTVEGVSDHDGLVVEIFRELLLGIRDLRNPVRRLSEMFPCKILATASVTHYQQQHC
jgi:hypothetical protein